MPEELVLPPLEIALFRAAKMNGAARPALARFLGHVDALGLAAAAARD